MYLFAFMLNKKKMHTMFASLRKHETGLAPKKQHKQSVPTSASQHAFREEGIVAVAASQPCQQSVF